MTANYSLIYDDIITQHEGYNRSQNSPGYRACLMSATRLMSCQGPSLDVGCCVGFVVELLSLPMFGFESWGTDVSSVAIERAADRVPSERLRLMTPGKLPFEDSSFGLVTCFDVLEHLDESDIDPLLTELQRVLRPGGLVYCTASCRPAGSVDQFGVNLHRTIQPTHWWIDRVQPDEALVRPAMADVHMWKRKSGCP